MIPAAAPLPPPSPRPPLHVIRRHPRPSDFLGIVPLSPAAELEEESVEDDDDDATSDVEEIIPLAEGGESLDSDNSDESDADPFIDD